MASYYGVTRTSEYLAHYGIRGMKWGVRKARNNTGKNNYNLMRQFMKDQRHLDKLTVKSDRSLNRAMSKYSAKTGAKLLGVGAAGLSGMYGVKKMVPLARKYGEAGRLVATSLGGLSGGVAGAGIGTGGLLLAKSAVHKYRASKNGHEKAIKKRKEFQKEMIKAYNGTEFRNKKFLKENPYAFVGQSTGFRNIYGLKSNSKKRNK